MSITERYATHLRPGGHMTHKLQDVSKVTQKIDSRLTENEAFQNRDLVSILQNKHATKSQSYLNSLINCLP